MAEYRTELRSAIGLALAGLITLWAAVWNQFYSEWAYGRTASKILILAAIVLGVAAMAIAGRQVNDEPRIPRTRGNVWILTVLLALPGLVAGWALSGAPPTVDCLSWQRDAVATLLQGRDPYGTSHANIYSAEAASRFYGPGTLVNGRVQVGLTYPPATLLVSIPGYLLGDVRYGYAAAIMLSAILVFALFPDERGLLVAAFILLAPTTFYVEYECWTEPLVWMLLCGTIYAAVKRPRWLPVALGLFLASKQYNFLAVPLIGYLVMPFNWKTALRLGASSLAIALATVLPFAIWDAHALWHDLYTFLSIVPVRQDALSFAIPFPIYARIGPLLLIGFMVWAIRREAKRPVMFAAGYGMALMLFFSASEQAFLNYYFLISFALLLAAAGLWPQSFADKGSIPERGFAANS